MYRLLRRLLCMDMDDVDVDVDVDSDVETDATDGSTQP